MTCRSPARPSSPSPGRMTASPQQNPPGRLQRCPTTPPTSRSLTPSLTSAALCGPATCAWPWTCRSWPRTPRTSAPSSSAWSAAASSPRPNPGCSPSHAHSPARGPPARTPNPTQTTKRTSTRETSSEIASCEQTQVRARSQRAGHAERAHRRPTLGLLLPCTTLSGVIRCRAGPSALGSPAASAAGPAIPRGPDDAFTGLTGFLQITASKRSGSSVMLEATPPGAITRSASARRGPAPEGSSPPGQQPVQLIAARPAS